MKTRELVDELRQITNPAILKTDDEAKADRARAQEICRTFNVQYPDDVFDRFGKYPQ